jgi:ribosomal protein S18 acetylase RimI-like enzyme
MSSEATVGLVSAEAAYPLRHAVLRPGLPVESVRFRGDDHPEGAHAAAILDGDHGDDSDHPDHRDHRHHRDHAVDVDEIVSVGTIFPDPPPWDPAADGAWRIRGMATAEGVRGRGFGRRVLDALIAHAVAHGASLVWCHARAGAVDFYRRAGFVTTGEPFHDAIAPHQSMYRVL